MRSYMKDGRCTICGAYRTDATLERFQEAIDTVVAQTLSPEVKPEEITLPTECCPVPDYIGLRDFATSYYGRLWYVSPTRPWTVEQLQTHYEETIFISRMYHLYRFGNYADLQKYFEDYDNGEILVREITDEVLPAYTLRAVDPGSDLGKEEVALDAVRALEMEAA